MKVKRSEEGGKIQSRVGNPEEGLRWLGQMEPDMKT